MGSALPRTLGAPGIYRLPAVPARALTGERMDICAFLGVAPRGPAREPVRDETVRQCQPDRRVRRPIRRTVPVPVESFDEYRRLYGGFEGPGLLPYAVASFFEQGGRRAYIARIVHAYATPAENAGRVARGVIAGAVTTAGPLGLRARNEGSWGNQLRAALVFRSTPLRFRTAAPGHLTVPHDAPLEAGALLRLTLPGGLQVYRFVTQLIPEEGTQRISPDRQATLAQPVAQAAERAELVEAELALDDGAGRTEIFPGLGLSALHPRWLATTLYYESRLVFPEEDWIDAQVEPSDAAAGVAFAGGADGYRDIVPEDFFDATWTSGDDEPGDGVMALSAVADVSLVVLPDLYSPAPLAPTESVASPPVMAGPTFERCVEVAVGTEEAPLAPADLDGLRLDPAIDLERIIGLQQAVVEFAEERRSFVALLDVPPRLTFRQVLMWRGQFSSAFAAAYHPWLLVARPEDRRDALIRVPPSAAAAGIIAERELARGVPHGPANVLAAAVVDVAEAVSEVRHDALHPEGINVYRREREGVRLTAARTLSREPAWRQLSVRRLVTMICRALERQMQWTVFEPNDRALRAELRLLLGNYLRQLFRSGAFRGAREEEGFFVRCDETNNPPASVDAGRLVAEIGIAPAEPLEFILLRLVRGGDGTFTLEER